MAEALLDAFPKPDRAGRGGAHRAAEQARDVLPDGLAERGYTVDILPVYRTVRAEPDAAAVDAGARRTRRRDHVHVVVDGCQPLRPARRRSRPAAARGVDRPGDLGRPHANAASQVDAEADPHTIDGLVDALVSSLQR